MERADILREKLDKIEHMTPEEHKANLIRITRVQVAYDSAANEMEGTRLVAFSDRIHHWMKILQEAVP